MKNYVPRKQFHDPEKAYEHGRLDALMRLNNVEYQPCKCEKCRMRYLDGQLSVIYWRTK